MQVEFTNDKITFFSASFSFHVPNMKTTTDIWKKFLDTPDMTICASDFGEVTRDIELIKKEYDIVVFRSPVYCFEESYTAGGETKIPFVYCRQAFEKVIEYLEKNDSPSEE